MAGKIRATVRLKRATQALVERMDDVALQLASEQKALILLRLRRGFGLSGQMPGYGPGYKAQRRRRGRRVEVRDLNFTGMMLRDLHSSRTGPGRAALRFRSGIQRQKAWANHLRHEWFGQTDDDRRQFAELLLSLGAKRK